MASSSSVATDEEVSASELCCIRADTLVVSKDVVLRPGFLTFENGVVTGTFSELPDGVREDTVLSSAMACPGYVDIHNHGFGHSDPSVDVVRYVIAVHYTQQSLSLTTKFLD